MIAVLQEFAKGHSLQPETNFQDSLCMCSYARFVTLTNKLQKYERIQGNGARGKENKLHFVALHVSSFVIDGCSATDQSHTKRQIQLPGTRSVSTFTEYRTNAQHSWHQGNRLLRPRELAALQDSGQFKCVAELLRLLEYPLCVPVVYQRPEL